MVLKAKETVFTASVGSTVESFGEFLLGLGEAERIAILLAHIVLNTKQKLLRNCL